jgi:hypothetical protein
MIKFEVHMNSIILKSMIHSYVQITFHETMSHMYPFVNNVGSAVSKIIWNFLTSLGAQIMLPCQSV